jgi:hypothetical protein
MTRGDAGQPMLVMEATEEIRADEFELFFRLLIPREYSKFSYFTPKLRSNIRFI